MRSHQFSYAATQRFSPLVLDYLSERDTLREMYVHQPSIQGLKEAAASRQFTASARQMLTSALRRQYRDVNVGPAVRRNLELLANEDCLTITTGHQLCLFGGPMYLPFKILNVVRLAARLTQERGGKPVVPIFWMATEDHDRAEIDHTWINGEKVEWPGEKGGPVGPMKLDGIGTVLDRAIRLLGEGGHVSVMKDLLETSYRPEHTLAQATRLFVNGLFGHLGVVCLDGDESSLKRAFIPAFQEELINQVGERTVAYANAKLEEQYDAQAYVREINVFHMRPGFRSRIILADDGFQVLDGGPKFTLDGLLEELNAYPERFSPNVLLRPIYQETVLPNVAYVGGGGELAYWLQMRWLFQGLQVPMPVVLLRTSAAFISEKHLRQWSELGLSAEDLFASYEPLRSEFAQRSAPFDTDLGVERERMVAFYKDLLERAGNVEPGLKGTVEARKASALNGLDRVEKAFVRAAKRDQAIVLERMDRIHEGLFPFGGLQERRENILPMIADQGTAFLDGLMDRLDPLAKEFTLFEG